METDRLIHSLAADRVRSRGVGTWLGIGLAIGGLASVIIFMLVLKPRPDLATALHNPFFLLKFMVTLGIAGPALWLALRLSRPEAGPGRPTWLLALPMLLLLAGMAADLMLPATRPLMTRLVGSNALVCLLAIPAMSIPLLIAALVALRHGATGRPAQAGAVAGLLAAALSATLYAAHCPDDSPFFVFTWYGLATVLVALAGAELGRRLLRF